ncbi:MAG: isochorismatase family protein [Chloroflexota bacterium]
MATIREGKYPVLLIVDVQNGVMRETWEPKRIIENIGIAVAKAREQNIPIIWVQHSDDEVIHGSNDWQWVSEIQPAPSEWRVDKQYNSSFEQTALDETLNDLGATHIYLAGAATNWCVRATAYGALERGYDLTLISDGHTTETLELGDSVTINAADVIRELNVVMQWVAYPGRKTAVLPATEINFNTGT